MRYVLSLFLLVLLAQGVWAEEYQDAAKGFALTPAQGWVVEADPEAFGTNLVVTANKEDPYAPSIQVMVWPGEPTINDYFQNQEMTLVGTADNALIFKDAQLAGQKAGSFFYTLNKTLKTMTFYTIANGHTYVVSQTARIKEFEDNRDAFEQMTASFRLLGE